MLQAVPDLDTLVVAVGGGGLIAGIAVAAKALKPGIEIIGVQTLRFPNMFNAVKHASLPQGGQHHRRRHRRRHAGQDHRRPSSNSMSTTCCWWTRATSSRPS